MQERKIFYYEVVTSTQDVAIDLITSSSYVGDDFAVIASRQTEGRGRSGKKWISSTPGNLYMSVGTKNVSDCYSSSLPIVLAVSVAESIGLYNHSNFVFKWPNDMFLGNSKVAGILVEKRRDCYVIGIGVNVFFVPVVEDVSTTNLLQNGFVSSDVDEGEFLLKMADNILSCISKNLISLSRGDSNTFIKRWRDYCWKQSGDMVDIKIGTRVSFSGKFLHLNDDGTISVDIDGKVKNLSYGDVSF